MILSDICFARADFAVGQVYGQVYGAGEGRGVARVPKEVCMFIWQATINMLCSQGINSDVTARAYIAYIQLT